MEERVLASLTWQSVRMSVYLTLCSSLLSAVVALSNSNCPSSIIEVVQETKTATKPIVSSAIIGIDFFFMFLCFIMVCCCKCSNFYLFKQTLYLRIRHSRLEY